MKNRFTIRGILFKCELFSGISFPIELLKTREKIPWEKLYTVAILGKGKSFPGKNVHDRGEY